MKNIRLVHFYLGVFFAPTIVFFAFSGILQVFKLHESYRETPGAQGDWIAWMAQVHKEQSLAPPRPAPARKTEAAAPEKEREPRSTAMKGFTALMGASLIATTFLGLCIAFNYPRRRMGFGVALALGLLAPIVLLKLG
ncbi:MAG: hypothetical protein ACXWGU_15035 [Usitatibacter sp.]